MLISSYGELQLLFNALSRVKKNCVAVLVFDNLDLFNFLSRLRGSLYLAELSFVPRFARQNYRTAIKYLIERKYYRSKLHILKHIYENVKLAHCFSIYQNHFCYQMIYALWPQLNEVIIYSPVACEENKSTRAKLISVPKKMLNKYLYGKNFTALNVGHKIFDIVEPKLYKSHKVTRVELDACDAIKRNTDIQDFFTFEHGYEVIFFDQPLVNYGRVDKKKFISFFRKIKKSFSDHISKGTMCVKLHPGNHSDKKFFQGVPIIEGEIPSQTIRVRPGQIWLSVSSQSIWEKVQGVDRISLLNLIEFEDPDQGETIFNNFLDTSKGDVFMPKTHDELATFVKTRSEINLLNFSG